MMQALMQIFTTYQRAVISVGSAIWATAAMPYRLGLAAASCDMLMWKLTTKVFIRLLILMWYQAIFNTAQAILLTPVFIVGPVLQLAGPLQGALMIGAVSGTTAGLMLATDPWDQLGAGVMVGAAVTAVVILFVVWVTHNLESNGGGEQ